MKDRIINSAVVSLFLTFGALAVSWFIPSSKYVQDVGIMTVVPERADYYGVPFIFKETGSLHRELSGQVDFAMLAANVIVYFIVFFLLTFVAMYFASKADE